MVHENYSKKEHNRNEQSHLGQFGDSTLVTSLRLGKRME